MDLTNYLHGFVIGLSIGAWLTLTYHGWRVGKKRELDAAADKLPKSKFAAYSTKKKLKPVVASDEKAYLNEQDHLQSNSTTL